MPRHYRYLHAEALKPLLLPLTWNVN